MPHITASSSPNSVFNFLHGIASVCNKAFCKTFYRATGSTEQVSFHNKNKHTHTHTQMRQAANKFLNGVVESTVKKTVPIIEDIKNILDPINDVLIINDSNKPFTEKTLPWLRIQWRTLCDWLEKQWNSLEKKLDKLFS